MLIGAAAPAAAAAADEAYRGTVQASVADDFEAGTSRTTFELVSSTGGNTPLAPANGRTRDELTALSGRPAIVQGSDRGDRIRVSAARAWHTQRRSTAADPGLGSSHLGDLSVAVFMVNFPSDTSQPFTAGEIRSNLFDGEASAAAGIRQQSAGRANLSGVVYGWWTLGGFDSCDYNAVRSAVEAHASANGIDPNAFERIAIMMPNQSCFSFGGLGNQPGRVSWYNGYNTAGIYLHELGHNSGLGHANLQQCTSGGANVVIAAPSSCASDEYGDEFDYMGTSYLGTLTGAFNRAQLGLMDAPPAVVRVSGVGQAASIDLSHLNQESGTREILVPRRIPGLPTTFFSLDLRSPASPFDSWEAGDPAVTGVTVRLTPVPGTIGTTELVDFAAATGTAADAPMPAGTTLSDPSSGVRVSVDTVGGGHAGVRVVGPATPDVTPPGGFGSISVTGRIATASWGSLSDDEGGPVRVELRRDGVTVAGSPATSGTLAISVIHPGVTTFQLLALDASGNPTSLDIATVTAPDASPVVSGARVSGRTISWSSVSDDWGVGEIRVLRRSKSAYVLQATLGPTARRLTVLPLKSRQRYIVRAVDGAGHTGSSALLTVRHDVIHARRLRSMKLQLRPAPRARIRGRTIRVVARYPAGIQSIKLRLGARRKTCKAHRSCTLRGSASALRRASGLLSINIRTKDGEAIRSQVRIRRGRLGRLGKLR